MSETAATTQKTSRFAGFEQEERKRWDDGWYSGVIVAEYETSGNFATVHKTQDVPSTAGDSRNLKLCVTVVNGNDTKSLNTTINYRPEALDPERMEDLRVRKAAKEQFKGSDFRDSMSLSKFHELERAGIPVEDNGHGGMDVDKMIGIAADFYLGTRVRKDKDGKDDRAVTDAEKKTATEEERKGWYHKITQIAAVDTKVKR
jgi:hypothetical protein